MKPAKDDRIPLLVVGPTPPPSHGVSVTMRLILDSRLRERFRMSHVELADRRGIAHVGKPDIHDVFLFVSQWLSLIRRLLSERPRVVYLAISQSTIGVVRDSFFIWPSRLFGARVIIHLHGGGFRAWYERRGRTTRSYVRLMLGAVARVIVLGETLRGLFDGLVAPGRVAVVPNGVSWARGHGPAGAVIPKRRSVRILHFGTLSRLKGALVLLTSVPLVLRARSDVEFVFAGPWLRAEDQRWAEEFVRRQQFGESVVFAEPASEREKRALFESADLFVFPAVQQEGQPLVVLEAMAAGLPVVCTDRGCLRETVVEGETGLFVRHDDPGHLAEIILRLLERPGEMKAMGGRARSRAESLYTGDRFLENLERVFLQVARDVIPS